MEEMSIERIEITSRRELEVMIVKEIETIEEELTTMGNQVPINGQTKLDVLCHDENGQLVVFKLSVTEDDGMLFEGLKALNQLDAVKHILKFHYQNFKISDHERPRLVLIAPSFSKNLQTIANHISGMRIDLYEWEYLKFGDNKGLRVKPISISKETREKKKSKRRGRKEKASVKVEKQEPSEEVVEEPDYDSGVPAEPQEPEKQENSQKPVSWQTDKKKEKTKKKTLLRF